GHTAEHAEYLPPSPSSSSSSRGLTTAASITQQYWTSQSRPRTLASSRVSAARPACVCRSGTRLLPWCPTSSMGTSASWLCLWRLSTLSQLLKSSRPSWLIHLHLQLLPLWLPLPRLKQRKSQWNQMRIWDSVSSTNPLKATKSASLI
ncbi:mCG5996, partial [Mus musculus]